MPNYRILALLALAPTLLASAAAFADAQQDAAAAIDSLIPAGTSHSVAVGAYNVNCTVTYTKVMQGSSIRSVHILVDWPAHAHMVLGTLQPEEKSDVTIDFTNASNKIQLGQNTLSVNRLGLGYDDKDVALTVPTSDGEDGNCVIARKPQQRAAQSLNPNKIVSSSLGSASTQKLGISNSSVKPASSAAISSSQGATSSSVGIGK